MKTVQLAQGVQSSILGFGCAPILGAVGAGQAERALGTALDHGITHFDVARSYGYGEAEKFLGRFLHGRRDEVVIASKFGIRATWKASLLRPLKPLVRTIRPRRGGPPGQSTTPAPQSPARKDPFHERVPLTAAEMRGNLEHSLRALKTDHLDLFFVHEPTAGIPHIDELSETAARLKDEGKIRAWGLAFGWRQLPALESIIDAFDVLQFDASPGAGHYENARSARAGSPNVIFSPMRHRGGLDPTATLRKLWEDFPRSVVLCSMFDPSHIRANAGAAG